MQPNVADAAGLSFACQPGCGFCCTATPLVQPREAGPLGPLVVRADDGTLRIPMRGAACGALGADRRCTVYLPRPSVCHLYPYQVHAGRRIQVTATLACPGMSEDASTREGAEAAEAADEGARRAAALALAQPGAEEMARRAKEAFAEFDRRMKEWGQEAPPDRLRAAFLPHLGALARPATLPAWFARLADGDLALGKRPAAAVAALLEAEEAPDVEDLLAEAAREAFEDADDALWVEPDLAWTRPRWRDGKVELRRSPLDGAETTAVLDPAEAPVAWADEATLVLSSYLRRVAHRDHAEGAAAWVVDASGYHATPAAAFGRVLGETALQVAMRAGLLALEAGLDEVTPAFARRGVAAYETSFHSLPTIGSVL